MWASASVLSAPPRAACAAAVSHVADPVERRLGGVVEQRHASAVSACLRATSCGSGEGVSARASSSPYGVEAAAASRSTIAGKSSTARAFAMRRV